MHMQRASASTTPWRYVVSAVTTFHLTRALPDRCTLALGQWATGTPSSELKPYTNITTYTCTSWQMYTGTGPLGYGYPSVGNLTFGKSVWVPTTASFGGSYLAQSLEDPYPEGDPCHIWRKAFLAACLDVTVAMCKCKASMSVPSVDAVGWSHE
jgi:hypothetical protein